MLVLTSVMVTAAPATKAWLLSVIVPSRVPFTAWPYTKVVAAMGPKVAARTRVSVSFGRPNLFIILSPSESPRGVLVLGSAQYFSSGTGLVWVGNAFVLH